MRKILFLMAMLVCSLQFAMAGDVVTRDVNKLPVAAREMIGKHFSQTKVAYIKIEKDLFQSTSYDVKLADGIELEFNSKGEWLEIDCKNKAVPSTFIPQAISKYMKAKGYKDNLRSRGLVFSYALAVSEENASGGKIVTAPTCGSCGVVPAVLYHLQKSRDFSDMRILRALATAGLIGNIVKHNASISGAEAGCQAEVGVACSMASAAASQLFGGSPAQIEYAAEMGLEHHLGMTCDPVCGLVQIPCIERNAYAAARALDANIYSAFTDGNHRVSFDKVVEVMKQTGHDLPSLYKETSEGGLAKDYEPMD
jgi:L-serine deaminase